MKVLFINTVYKRGSTGRIVADLGQMLEENGHEYKVAYGRGNHRDDSHCYRVGNDIDMYIHAGLSRITDRAGFYSKCATKRLIKFIRSYNPDIIHLHNLHGYYLNIEILLKFLAEEYKGRVIWTLHDCWAFTGHCTYYSFAKCEKWKEHCGSCIQKGNYPCTRVFDQSEKNLKEKKELYKKLEKKLEVVTVSHWLEDQVKLSSLQGARIRTIYNGVDTEIFQFHQNDVRNQLGIGNKHMFLAVSDDWDDRKGYEKLFELADVIDDKSVIVVIGLSKSQIAELPDNIIGLEHTWDQNQLIDYYSAADVLFNPSKEETFGLVTAEALSCGTPAIVYNTTACPEIVGRDNKAGVILDTNCSLSDAANILFFDKQELTDNCRAKVEKEFSLNKMIRQYYKLYSKNE